MSESTNYDPNLDPTIHGETMVETQYPTLETFGLGTGGVAEGFVLTPEIAKSFDRIAAGEFNVEVEDTVAAICIDERFEADGTRSLLPRSAGGPIGNAHAHDLALGSLNEGISESELVADDTESLVKVEPKVCAHGDDHDACGCGQAKRAKEVYGVVRDNIDALANVSDALGVPVSSDQKAQISGKADLRLSQDNFFAEDRASLLDTAQEAGAGLETVVGQHDGVFILWMTDKVKGQSPDMERVFAETGLKGFVVHAWSFRKTAEALNITGSQEETDQTVRALVLKDLATASVLCSKDIAIIVQ